MEKLLSEVFTPQVTEKNNLFIHPQLLDFPNWFRSYFKSDFSFSLISGGR